MSFADDLWDGFANVGKWEQQGTAMCKSICRFYRKRAKIEEAYGRSMFKLVQQITDEIQQPGGSYCNDTICYGTLGSGWVATCHNAQVQAELHLNFAEQIRKNIVENLQVNTLQLEDQLKQITKDGERLLVDQDQWMTTLKKTKQAYYKSVKEAEAAKSVFDESSDSKMFSSKAEKRVNKASQEAQTAELAYHAQLKHTNSFMNSFNLELMPRVMKRLEDVSRSRQQLLLHHFKELARISQEMPNGLASAGNALAKAVNLIDVQKDVQDFVKFNKTNQPKPQPFQYEPPSEDVISTMDSNKKGKHNFFTIARKSKGSPQSLSVKGNPGSPPSLSPSPSVLIIREKAFKFSIFGNALDEIMGCQREVLPDCDIPYFLLVLALDILRSNAFCLEGVFRITAPNHEIETLSRQFDSGNYDLSSIQSPYTTTHLIKKWCRDLPDPLIPSYLYERCIACNTQEEAREILPMIPPLYHKVVVFLTQLLYEFSQPAYLEQSKMNAANFAMVFSPSFLRCASTEMADFLLNVHREKNFVQLLIEGVEERLNTDYIESLMAPLDEIIFTKENPKWHPSKQIAVPPLQLAQINGEVHDDDLKSELQRQASEREMILVKQQQLRKLTARDDLSDPKALHAKLLDERAEKERFQDSVMLKDKTIQVMRTELNHTLQEKLKLENAVKALQNRIEKLANNLESEEPFSNGLASEPVEVEGLVSWTPMRINVKENIQNYESRTRSFRSGSVDTGVDLIKQTRASSPWGQKLHRSLSPVAQKAENRNTLHLGDIQNFKIEQQPEIIAPFKLPNSPTLFTLNADSAKSPPFRSLLAPLSEEQNSPRIVVPTNSSPSRKNPSSAPSSPRRSARGSPQKESPVSSPTSPISPRRDIVASPRGVSFRDLGTVHVYPDTAAAQDIVATATDILHQVAESSPRHDTPKVPRIKLLNAITPPLDPISPRARHAIQSATSPRSTSTTTLQTPATTTNEVNSPRNPRHSTPAIGASPPAATSPRAANTFGFSSKKHLAESDPPPTVTRTFSFSSGKRKNSLKSSAPETSPTLSKKSEEKKDKKNKSTSLTSSIDDQRIFDLLNTNVQKYDALSKKDNIPTPPKPPSSGFQFKLRQFLQKQPKEDKKNAYAPIPDKSPRSPKTSPRVHSPRNRPHSRAPAPTVGSLPTASAPISPRLYTWPEDPDYQPTSPRQSRRTLSFPTPRVQNTSSSSLNLANSPPRGPSLAHSPRPTRSQTFIASGAASAQELHNLALEVDRMNKEVHKRLCACVETIGNTTEYAQTIEISKSIRLLIKCLDLALSKLGVDERQMRQLGTGKSTLPEMKPLAAEDTRLKKLREVLVISLDRIVGQMRCIANIAAQITMQDDVNVVSQTLSELQLFFSKQDQTISKIGPQEMVEGIRQKIAELKATWYEIPLDRQVEISKIVLDVKKDTDEFCTQNSLQLEPDQTPPPNSDTDSQDERITKSIFSTLDKIHALCLVILQNTKLRTLRHSDNMEEGQFTEKLLEIFKSLSTK